MGKCAIINGVCPETADRTKKRFCPHWNDGLPEVERDGSGRVVAEHVYRGCFLDRLPLYLLALAADSGHAAASYDSARNEVLGAVAEGREPVARALVELGVMGLAGAKRTALEAGSGENGAAALPAATAPADGGGG